MFVLELTWLPAVAESRQSYEARGWGLFGWGILLVEQPSVVKVVQRIPKVAKTPHVPQGSRLCLAVAARFKSAYAHVYQGQHDYKKHPFVPIGMDAMVHEMPHKRRTFAQHCKKGYVLGTSFEHYRCQTI
jgi:hypothetical protein